MPQMQTERSRFNGWSRLPEAPNQNPDQFERFTYVGCVHGMDDDFSSKLNNLADAQLVPNYLIFNGDITGSPAMEESKKLFYNYVFNLVKGPLTANPNISDEDLVSLKFPHGPLPDQPLKVGYLMLMEYIWALEGKDQAEVKRLSRESSTKDIADGIRGISDEKYYLPWIGKGPVELQKALVKDLEKSARAFMGPIDKIRERGTRVLINAGNWEEMKETGFKKDFKLLSSEEIFDTANYLQSEGLEVYRQIAAVETDTSLQIFVPHIEVGDIADLDQEFASQTSQLTREERTAQTQRRITQVTALAEDAREKGRVIILTVHNEVNWQIHHLNVPIIPPVDDYREKAIDRLGKILIPIKPNRTYHAHQHNRLRDEDNNLVEESLDYIVDLATGKLANLTNEASRPREKANLVPIHYIPYRQTSDLWINRTNPRSGLFLPAA